MGITAAVFAKLDYVARDKKVPLYLRLTIHRKVKPPIDIDLRVLPEHWDKAARRVTKGHPGFDSINAAIIEVEAKATKIIQKYKILERVLSFEYFLKEYAGLNVCDFFVHAADYIKGLEGEKSEEYVKKVKFIVGKIKAFRPSLDINDIDFKFIKDYQHWCITKRANGKSTVYSNLRIFRRILDDAVAQDIIKVNPFVRVKLQKPKTHRDPLTIEELKKFEQLLDYDLPYYLHKTLCWFLLAIYTGRRYGDIATFYTWEIHNEYIRITQMKRMANHQERKITMVYINDRIRKIITLIRERDYQPLENRTVNKFLKELASRAGVFRKLTFHITRYTFAAVNQDLQDDLHTRKDLLGHDSINSTLGYERPKTEKMKETMLRWNSL